MAPQDQVNTSASVLYSELRRLAHHYMRGERPGHVLQTTALVNEAYLRLAGLTSVEWRDREHFVAMAATAMRRILVDEARAKSRDKRGGAIVLTSIDGHDAAAPPPGVNVEALDRALDELARIDRRQARIVELRFFAGLTMDETAAALGISPATVGREWVSARAWLHHHLTES
jgi:RNA polymerase sigma-70 factor (ECF subfamily)